MNLPKEKLCKGCSTIKPADQFSVAKSKYKDKVYYSLQYRCKPCIVARSNKSNRVGYVRPSRQKVLNEVKEIQMMKSPVSWQVHKYGVEKYNHKEYPICQEGHRYVGPICLPCKYQVFARGVV